MSILPIKGLDLGTEGLCQGFGFRKGAVSQVYLWGTCGEQCMDNRPRRAACAKDEGGAMGGGPIWVGRFDVFDKAVSIGIVGMDLAVFKGQGVGGPDGAGGGRWWYWLSEVPVLYAAG